MRKIIEKLESPEMGKLGFPIFALSMGILCIWVCIWNQLKFEGSAMENTSTQTMRQSCIEYVIQFDDTVETEKQIVIKEYFNNTIKADLLFQLTTQNTQLVFSKNVTEIKEEGKYIYVPLNVNVEELNNFLYSR
jgi:hypothetical protein